MFLSSFLHQKLSERLFYCLTVLQLNSLFLSFTKKGFILKPGLQDVTVAWYFLVWFFFINDSSLKYYFWLIDLFFFLWNKQELLKKKKKETHGDSLKPEKQHFLTSRDYLESSSWLKPLIDNCNQIISDSFQFSCIYYSQLTETTRFCGNKRSSGLTGLLLNIMFIVD